MTARKLIPVSLRRKMAAQPNGMTRTIARFVARHVVQTGHTPDADTIAAVLAISVTRVRHHLRLIGAGSGTHDGSSRVRDQRHG